MDAESTGHDNTLLTSEEAADQLGRILTDWFTWALRAKEDGKPLTRVLIKSPPGLGKTRSTLQEAVAYQLEVGFGRDRTIDDILNTKAGDVGPTGTARTVIFTHRHDLAQAAKSQIEEYFQKRGHKVEIPVLRGRANQHPGFDPPCKRWREADAIQDKGYPVFANLCKRGGDDGAECPHFGSCEYLDTRRAALDAPIVIMVHAHLGTIRQLQSVYWDALYDEMEHHRYWNLWRYEPEQATIIICDEDPTQALVETEKFSEGMLSAALPPDLSRVILDGLASPEGLLSDMRNAGILPEHLCSLAGELEENERRARTVTNPAHSDESITAAMQRAGRFVPFSRIVRRLADELDTGRDGKAYSLLRDGEGEKLLAQCRRPFPFDKVRSLFLDGTANPDYLRQFVPGLKAPEEIRVRRKAHIVQTSDLLTFYRGSLVKEDENGEFHPTARLHEVARFIKLIAKTGNTFVVTNKKVRRALTGEQEENLPVSAKALGTDGADIAHFGNIRGVNDFEKYDNAIILGRNQLSVDEAERTAMAVWYDTDEPISRIDADANGNRNLSKERRRYLKPDGGYHKKIVLVKVHPDPRVQMVVEQIREAESVQAVDRLRLVHNDEPKYVWILCNIPLDLPVDTLTTWPQLQDCSEKLCTMIERCNEEGRNAILLPKAELARQYPDLWKDEKAADKWLQKKPLECSKGIIRNWGFLKEYRPQGQSSWSKAIVKHSVKKLETELEALAGEPVILRKPCVSENPNAAPR